MKPPELIPEDLREDFTLNHTIDVAHRYIDETAGSIRDFNDEKISSFINRIKNRELFYYKDTDVCLYSILERHPLKNLSVGIVGSLEPLYECFVLAYGGKPTTIEYNEIKCSHPDITTMTVDEYNSNPIQFDCVLSISSIEHDGLGRYGDPVDPYGDFKAIKNIKNNMLKSDGKLILAVPMGKDKLVWNAHRVYGRIRWPKLIEGWEVVDSAGFKDSFFDIDHGIGSGHQPVWVLQKGSANDYSI